MSAASVESAVIADAAAAPSFSAEVVSSIAADLASKFQSFAKKTRQLYKSQQQDLPQDETRCDHRLHSLLADVA